VIGVLLGTKTADYIDIVNSFELVVNDYGLDREYLTDRLSQQRTILPQEEVVGLYEISRDLSVDFVSSLKDELEGIALNLSFSPEKASKKYSNERFYSVFEASTGAELKVETATKTSEKIAVDTVLDIKEKNYNDLDKIQDQVNSQRFILMNLREKIAVISKLLKSDESSINIDNYHQFLRDVNSFVHKLNYKQSPETKESLVQLENQYNLLLNLGQISDNLAQMNKINTELKKLENVREML
jgi:hypothetical protein